MAPGDLEREIARIIESQSRRAGRLRPGSVAPFYGSICALETIVHALEDAVGGDKRLRARFFRADVLLSLLSSLRNALYSDSLRDYVAALDSLLDRGSVVLVYGYGDLLAQALLGVKYKLGRVWSVEAEPLGTGRRMAHTLKREGVEAYYAPSVAKSSLVGESDVILARVYSSTVEGYLVADPGAYGLLRLAHLHGKPVYAFSEDLGLLGCAGKDSVEASRIPAGRDPGGLELPAFEAIHHSLFTGIVYEEGLVRDGVGRLIKLYRERIRSLATGIVGEAVGAR
jgi:hypothetical protein